MHNGQGCHHSRNVKQGKNVKVGVLRRKAEESDTLNGAGDQCMMADDGAAGFTLDGCRMHDDIRVIPIQVDDFYRLPTEEGIEGLELFSSRTERHIVPYPGADGLQVRNGLFKIRAA